MHGPHAIIYCQEWHAWLVAAHVPPIKQHTSYCLIYQQHTYVRAACHSNQNDMHHSEMMNACYSVFWVAMYSPYASSHKYGIPYRFEVAPSPSISAHQREPWSDPLRGLWLLTRLMSPSRSKLSSKHCILFHQHPFTRPNECGVSFFNITRSPHLSTVGSGVLRQVARL